MRTIKFRGKRLDNDQWMYGYVLHCDLYTDIWTDEEGFEREEVDPDTVGQFTGLYDKNGKEIYEGDILEYKDPINGKTYRRKVVFHDAAFCQEIDLGTPKPEYNPIRNHDLTVWSVVGNIHDNPELLKGGDR